MAVEYELTIRDYLGIVRRQVFEVTQQHKIVTRPEGLLRHMPHTVNDGVDAFRGFGAYMAAFEPEQVHGYNADQKRQLPNMLFLSYSQNLGVLSQVLDDDR